MAPKNPYLPPKDQDRLIWLKNFSQKFTGYATTLGFLAGDATAVTDMWTMYEYTLGGLETFRTWTQNLTSFKGQLSNGPITPGTIAFPATPTLAAAPTATAPGIFKNISGIVQRIKGHPNYTDAIGQDLGIIGSEVIIDPFSLKPDIKVKLDGVRPLIQWKKGVADSINIYVDRNDGAGFIFLVNDTVPDYIDTHELPAGVNSAIWDYKARYRIGDDEVGVFSDVISITVSRQL